MTETYFLQLRVGKSKIKVPAYVISGENPISGSFLVCSTF